MTSTYTRLKRKGVLSIFLLIFFKFVNVLFCNEWRSLYNKEQPTWESKGISEYHIHIYLPVKTNTLNPLQFARQFYMAQWFRDSSVEAEKTMATQAKAEEDFDETEAERSTEVMQNVEKRKNFLLNQVAIMSKILSNSK